MPHRNTMEMNTPIAITQGDRLSHLSIHSIYTPHSLPRTTPETRRRWPTPERSPSPVRRSPSPVRRTETRSLPAPNGPTRPREETNDSIQMPYGTLSKEDSAAERFFNNTSKE